MADAQVTQNPSEAYVYEVLVDGVVRYIGKGRGGRAGSHVYIAQLLMRKQAQGRNPKTSSFYRKLIAALLAGSCVSSRIVSAGLSDREAFDQEVACIANAPAGQLWNVSKGGNGVSSEYLKRYWSTPERKKALSERAKAARRDHPESYAARFPDAASRERQAEMLRLKWQDPEYRAMQAAARRNGKPREYSPVAAAKVRERWADSGSGYRERVLAAMHTAAQAPDVLARRQRTLNAIRATSAWREKQSAAQLARRARERAERECHLSSIPSPT